MEEEKIETENDLELNFSDNDENDINENLENNLNDIRIKIMHEFQLNEGKWSGLLAEFINRAIETVKPSSFSFKDSIDITKYVKI
jgi:hypothetical protein